MLRSLASVLLALGLAACSSSAPGAVQTESKAVAGVVAPAQTAPPTITRSAWFKYAPWNSSLPELKKTNSGLEYIVLASGPATGIAPLPEQSAKIYYEGRLNSGGRAFDSAFDRGEPDVYELSILVPGFREALSLMRPGDRWLVYIPAALGYAERGYPGLIGPGENLLFEILMVGVQ
jgi:FKBP-type peptidyl-prolyl cis-trans isomerase